MANSRPEIQSSVSFSAAQPFTTPTRPLKRSHTTTSTSSLGFFTSAAESFNPLPYSPPTASRHETKSRPRGVAAIPRNTRQRETAACPSNGLDPSPDDEKAVFIHPPFNNFPYADQVSLDGLTYALMAENPEWFLDAADFIWLDGTNTSPSAIAYPAILEPPRGWCPAKKRDLKEMGSDGWPEGEEPRLRCTFCRRTYAGVNAKSMWRRHVFEKHKIAMANRRDTGNDRPRGRGFGSTKENKQPVVQPTQVPIVFDITTTETRQARIANGSTASWRRQQVKETHPSPLSNPPVTNDQEPPQSVVPSSDPASPPLTPNQSSSDPANSSLETLDEEEMPGTPLPLVPAIPPTPEYDPSQTPAFRHSPAQPPSVWKFDSPSNPLSKNREQILGSLARPRLGWSPASLGLGFDSPFSKASPRFGLYLGGGNRLASSPMSMFASTPDKGHRKTLSSGSDDWSSPSFLSQDDDIFTASHGKEHSLEHIIPLDGADSPVKRSTHEPSTLRSLGLGVGLLEPFTLATDFEMREEEFEDLSLSSAKLRLSSSSIRADDDSPPPAKKRRT